MRFYIAVDCEGPACVVGRPGMMLSETPEWPFIRRQATREASAAAAGLFDGGAEAVIVWDNHGSGVNLVYDELDRRCQIAMGVGHAGRFPGLERGFAGVILLGYHAMDGTPEAVLAHTFSSSRFQRVAVNGEPVGEVYVDALAAGQLDVPVLMTVGDDKLGAEAARTIPGCRHVPTKRSLSNHSALSEHPLAILDTIRAAARELAQSPPAVEPLAMPATLEVELRYKRIEQADAALIARPTWRRLDAYTLTGRANDLLRAIV